jgi:hypothetical protein
LFSSASRNNENKLTIHNFISIIYLDFCSEQYKPKTRSNIKINSEKVNLIPTCSRKLSISCRRQLSLPIHHSSHPKCIFICISFILQTFQEKVSKYKIVCFMLFFFAFYRLLLLFLLSFYHLFFN